MKKILILTLACLLSQQSHLFSQKLDSSDNFKFIFTAELPPDARPSSGEGTSKVHVINQSKDYIGLGFINSEGNLSVGYTDGNKGQTDFYVGPRSRTNKDWPFLVANGSCFVLYTLKGKILGYGKPTQKGEYEIVVK